MTYALHHLEDLGAVLILLGTIGFFLRKKIAIWRARPNQERMVAEASREFTESLTQWSSLSLILIGALLEVLFRR
jgi:hypothetical protein